MGTNPLGLAFLAIYGGLFVIQFIALVWHRALTFLQLIAGVHKPWARSEDDYNDYDHLLPSPPDPALGGRAAGLLGGGAPAPAGVAPQQPRGVGRYGSVN